MGTRVTPIVPRFSATLVDPKIQRKLEHYEIPVVDAFQGFGGASQDARIAALCPRICRKRLSGQTQSVKESFFGLQEALAKLDPTLVEASQTGVSKIHYQLDRLRERAMAAELRRSDVVGRHAAVLSNFLYPEEALQERGIAGVYFVARYGTELLTNLYKALRVDCLDHQILEL